MVIFDDVPTAFEARAAKNLDSIKERRSWSGKKKINSYNLLLVMDHLGHLMERMFMNYLQVR
jgi:hypothetical protein